MASRNLTKKFVEMRTASRVSKGLGLKYDEERESGEAGLLKQQGGESAAAWKSMKNSLPPAWVEQIEKVDEDVAKIQLKMNELSALHKKRLKVDFETDETQQEREIDAKTREITEVFHHAENLLKRFGKQTEQSQGLTGEERTVRKNMQMSMAKKLQGLSMSFRSTQKQYLTQLQNQKSGGTPSLDFLNETKKVPSSNDFVDQGFVGAQMNVLEDVEDLVNQRDEEITRIAKSIEELAQIFRELAVLVIDQGTILDRIDYNMENAIEHAKEGIVQLEKAEEHQKNAMTTKCIIVLVLLIAIMIGVLIWKHSGK